MCFCFHFVKYHSVYKKKGDVKILSGEHRRCCNVVSQKIFHLRSYYICMFDNCRRFLQQDFDITLAHYNHDRKQRTEVCFVFSGITIDKIIAFFGWIS